MRTCRNYCVKEEINMVGTNIQFVRGPGIHFHMLTKEQQIQITFDQPLEEITVQELADYLERTAVALRRLVDVSIGDIKEQIEKLDVPQG